MDPSPEAILEHYEEGGFIPPKGFILFAIDCGPQGSDLYLDCRKEGEPILVRGEPSNNFAVQCRPKATSLMNALMATAFLTLRIPSLPFSTSLYARDSWNEHFGGRDLKPIHDWAKSLKFTPVPCLQSWNAGYDNGDIAFHGYEAPGFLPSFTLAAQEQEKLADLTQEFSNRFSLIIE